MTRYFSNALGALLSIGAMFGLNQQLRPMVDVQYAESEYTVAKGTLNLRRGTDNSEIGLMPMHVVTRDLARMGRVYAIRELTVRAAAPSAQTPSIELYVDISRVSGDLVEGAHDPQRLIQTELAILPTGRLGTRNSIVLLEGTTPRRVITGSVLLTEVSQMTIGDKPVYRTAGRLEMQVEYPQGIEMITGRIEGQISWDPTGA